VNTRLPSRVLVVGSGGREHALVRAIAASPTRPTVLCAPANAGIAAEAACFPVASDDPPGIVDLARREKVDYVVVGPDLSLALGLVDALEAAGIPAYGPRADGARLESSKIFTKNILLKHGIPTAPAAIFDDADKAIAWMRARPVPIVVKADGLAAGKGVVVASTREEAESAVRSLLALPALAKSLSRRPEVLIEECLTGEETSLLVVVSGRDYVILPTAQDHKRVGDGDTGPNTGGMGACSPAVTITADMLERIEREIVRPSVDAIAAEGIDFRGTLFIGLMMPPDGPKVLEFNTRFGDPETQAVLPRLTSDVLELLWAATTRRLRGYRLAVRPEAALCVVIATRGYPGSFPKGAEIVLPEGALLPPQTSFIHAGTARDASGRLVSAGGRVLGAVALAPTLREAADRAYLACERVGFEHKYCRRDIGARQFGAR
jgi:phosphoribosylamine---glycine ligase